MTKLAEQIEQQGVSVKALSAASGIPERTVYRHVGGQATPSLPQAAAYAKALGLRIEELVEAAA